MSTVVGTCPLSNVCMYVETYSMCGGIIIIMFGVELSCDRGHISDENPYLIDSRLIYMKANWSVGNNNGLIQVLNYIHVGPNLGNKNRVRGKG